MKVGVDLGGSHIGIGIVDNKGNIVEKFEKRLFIEDKKEIKNIIENYINQIISKLKDKYEITNIGIAVPGTVYENKIVKCVNLKLENYDIASKLKEKIKYPIKMANDCKCAALAENRYGVLKNYNRAIFLTLGTGIGGAVILENKLLDAGKYPGCEFGHMVIKKDGLLCKCGKKGCFEKYASMKTFKDKIRKTFNLDEKTNGQQILELINKNKENETINQIIDEYIENLCIGISNLVNIFEPEIIGIGGSFIYFSDILLEKLKNEIVKKPYLFNKRESLNIKTAKLGNDAGIIGSTLLI